MASLLLGAYSNDGEATFEFLGAYCSDDEATFRDLQQ